MRLSTALRMESIHGSWNIDVDLDFNVIRFTRYKCV